MSDVMRRYVKENLLVRGEAALPERHATTVKYDLSPTEQRLYDEVTEYVRTRYEPGPGAGRAATAVVA